MNIHEHHLKSPTQIITTQLGIPQEYKQHCIKEIYSLGDSMNQQTNVKAIMSSYKIWEETNILNQLINNIKITIDECYPPKNKKFKYNLVDAWSAIYKKSHYTIPHNHLPFQVSFVYYLQSSGYTPLVFDECNFQINPTDDMLIVFPSNLIHSVPEHTEENDRICLAGNLSWTFF